MASMIIHELDTCMNFSQLYGNSAKLQLRYMHADTDLIMSFILVVGTILDL